MAGKPVTCQLVAAPSVVPGDMWFAPQMIQQDNAGNWYAQKILAPDYTRDRKAARPPLFVCLPNGAGLCLDAFIGDGANTKAAGYTVTGEAPNITVAEVIDVAAGPTQEVFVRWQGTLKAGVLTELP